MQEKKFILNKANNVNMFEISKKCYMQRKKKQYTEK